MLFRSLKDRSYSNTYDFELTFNRNNCSNKPFHQNCLDFASKIYDTHKDLVISYSGGLDSEYVLKVFTELGIPFKTVVFNGACKRW